MSFLTIGGNIIPVGANTTPDRTKEEIGDRARAIDGTMRETIIARKRTWVVETAPVTRTVADQIDGWVEAAPPLVVNGDITGNVNVNCFGKVSSWKGKSTVNGYMVVAQITLMEQ